LIIELGEPDVEIGLQVLDRAVELLAEGDAIELVERRLVATLTEAYGFCAIRRRTQARRRIAGASPTPD
jgi:hypothetical protein